MAKILAELWIYELLKGDIMMTAKEEVRTLLEQLPDSCVLEDIQYHLYVVEKIKKGIDRAPVEGVYSQGEVEQKFSQFQKN